MNEIRKTERSCRRTLDTYRVNIVVNLTTGFVARPSVAFVVGEISKTARILATAATGEPHHLSMQK